MNIETRTSQEIAPKSNFTISLENLSSIDNPIPLSPEALNVAEIKAELLKAGIDVSPIENNPALQESIKHSQFRDENQGKGPAVIKVLEKESYDKYSDWAQKKSKDQPTLSSGKEDTKRRGLMQFLGETIALASGQITPEDYCRKTNLRTGKKYQKNPEISERFNLPKDEKGLKKLKETSSIPKGSALEAYQFILSLKK